MKPIRIAYQALVGFVWVRAISLWSSAQTTTHVGNTMVGVVPTLCGVEPPQPNLLFRYKGFAPVSPNNSVGGWKADCAQ